MKEELNPKVTLTFGHELWVKTRPGYEQLLERGALSLGRSRGVNPPYGEEPAEVARAYCMTLEVPDPGQAGVTIPLQSVQRENPGVLCLHCCACDLDKERWMCYYEMRHSWSPENIPS